MRSSRNSIDRLGMYTESSKASCSSSPSSSFSSLDYNKVMHPQPSSYDRIIFPETPLLDRSLSHSSSSWRMRHKSFDLSEPVREESGQLKDQDSPRPLQPLKLVTAGSPNVFSKLQGPLRVRDALAFYSEDGKPSRPLYQSKSDRTELEYYRHESKEMHKNCCMLNELARLSLDSIECPVQHCGLTTLHHIQRPPSIVEKLMGLEAMPRVTQNSNRFVQIGHTNMTSKSTSPPSPCMTLQISSAQRCSRKDQSVHKWRNGELVVKPMSSSRILIEPAPWKQLNSNRTSPVKNNKQGSACDSNGFPAIYSKFERRLKDIEFQRSSKDLKALKQMLDAVQQNGSWQAEKEVMSNGTTRNHNPDSNHLDETQNKVQQRKHQNVCRSVANCEQESCVKTLKSPIVVMKPYKFAAESDIAASSVIRAEGTLHLSKPHSSDSAIRRKALSNKQIVKGQPPRSGCQSPRISPTEKKLTHMLPAMPQRLSKKSNSAVLVRSASPRLKQKKFELEKKPLPATTSYDATKLSMPKSKQPRNCCASGDKHQSKSAFIQQYDVQSSGFSTESKDTSYCGDDTEVTSKLRLDNIDGGHSPSRKVVRPMFASIRKPKPSWRSSKDARLAHPANIAPEQPSPISVLDSTVYRDDPPSPLKKIASSGTDIKTGISSVNHLSANADGHTTNMSREKLKHIEDLVAKLKGISSTNDESKTDFIASLCETTNPDQRYISKILLSSGFLLLDFESTGNTFQPHFSGYPINPELFFVLEQTKSGALPARDCNKFSGSKSGRRFIFDSINEILAELLVPLGMSSEPKKLARSTITSRQLLKDLCDRTEQLQAKSKQECEVESEEDRVEENGLKKILFKELMLRSNNWANSDKGMPEVVLDIERMVFKDLVKEIVSDEAISRSKAERSCDRKLFVNKI